MAYTTSQAQAGRGTQLSIGPVVGTATPVYVPVFELKDVPFKGPEWDLVDVTNMNSAGFSESLLTIQKWPKLTLSGNYVEADPGQTAMQAAQATGGLYMFTLEYPKTATQTTAGKTISFNAYVLNYGTDLAVEKEQALTCDLQPSGAFTVTAGS